MGAQVLRAEAGGAPMEDDLVAMKIDISALRADVANVQDNLSDLRADVKELRGQMYTGFAQLRGEQSAGSGQLRGEMNTGFSELRVEIRDNGKRHDRDFRILFGALITLALGLSGLMAKGFGWIH